MAESLQNTSSLTINIDHLLKVQGVEKQRVEFKKAWKGSKQGRGPGTYWQVLHTICAFANDFYHDNGGYIIIGVEEEDSGTEADASGKKRQVKLPPCGILGAQLDRVQKEIMGACRAHIKPNISPILSPEVVDGENVLVIWTTASDNSPHQCRETEKGPSNYYIRKGTETKKASPEEVTQLLQQSNKIPFDDRMARDNDMGKQLSMHDIDRVLVNSFLEAVRSNLRGQSLSDESLYQKMNLVIKYGDHKEKGKMKPTLIPRNVALLFFSESPELQFRGAKIEIARYTQDKEVIEDKTMTGPIDKQIKDCLLYILELTGEEVSHACATYPERALREAVVNAVYHRGYEPHDGEPIKVHIRPDRIEITSYPGPHPSLKPEYFQDRRDIPSVPARNRRIGELLKDLKLAEARGTGVNTIFKTMRQNENPQPSFLFDTSFFQVTLPGHPKYIMYTLLADIDRLAAKGEKKEAVELLMDFLDKHPDMRSDKLAFKLLELHQWNRNHPNVQKYTDYFAPIFEGMLRRSLLVEELQAWSNQIPLKVDTGVRIIKELVKQEATSNELSDAKRNANALCHYNKNDLRKIQDAHKLLEAMGPAIITSNRQLAFDYGYCKYRIYRLNTIKKANRGATNFSLVSYLNEADEFLNIAIQLTSKEFRTLLAFQYRVLGYVHFELYTLGKSKATHVQEYYAKAKELKPDIKICNSCRVPN